MLSHEWEVARLSWLVISFVFNCRQQAKSFIEPFVFGNFPWNRRAYGHSDTSYTVQVYQLVFAFTREVPPRVWAGCTRFVALRRSDRLKCTMSYRLSAMLHIPGVWRQLIFPVNDNHNSR